MEKVHDEIDSVLRMMESLLVCGESKLSVDTTFDELQIEAMKLMELLVEIEDIYGIDFDFEMLVMEQYKTVGDLCAYILTLVQNPRQGGC